MLLRSGYLSVVIATTPLLLRRLSHHHSLHHHLHLLSLQPINAQSPMPKFPSLSTVSAAQSSPSTSPPSNNARKKARRESPEGILRQKLDMCSKRGDIFEALRLYDDALASKTPLSLHHYNVLLYLCSSCDAEGLNRGFEIYRQMGINGISPNEATFTSLARLAIAKEDPEMAFDLVKKMKICKILPKLRSYGPALFGFCEKNMADEAYEVDAHMVESGVLAEEPEISALLKVSAETKKGDKVYEMLHRLRSRVRKVSEETAGVVERWFGCEKAGEIGVKEWDAREVRERVLEGGGGWHGKGWLGSGKWRVLRTDMDENGVCLSCKEKLVCIDIDPKETENFALSLAKLACQREVKADFTIFQEWLKRHGPFDAVIDGANVGLVNGHTFSFSHLNSVVNQLQLLSPSKRLPLIVLHRSRVTGGPAQSPRNKKLIEIWNKSGVLYSTPAGSNDDWYWLFAAVSCNCLLLTNDEMRDHLFQLLGTNFFPRWKEKHQVRMMVSNSGPTLRMPPPYSIVIQESEQGAWHIPTVVGDDLETPRQWVCATRESRIIQ